MLSGPCRLWVRGGIALALSEKAASGSKSRRAEHGIARKPAGLLSTRPCLFGRKDPWGRGRNEDYSPPPAQIPASAANAPGSSLGSNVGEQTVWTRRRSSAQPPIGSTG